MVSCQRLSPVFHVFSHYTDRQYQTLFAVTSTTVSNRQICLNWNEQGVRHKDISSSSLLFGLSLYQPSTPSASLPNTSRANGGGGEERREGVGVSRGTHRLASRIIFSFLSLNPVSLFSLESSHFPEPAPSVVPASESFPPELISSSTSLPFPFREGTREERLYRSIKLPCPCPFVCPGIGIVPVFGV